MDLSDCSKDICFLMDQLKAWLVSRSPPTGVPTTILSAPGELKSIGFPDLVLEKFRPQHREEVVDMALVSAVTTFERPEDKEANWTELGHLVSWSNEFMVVLEKNKPALAALDMLRCQNDYPISVAEFHVDEAVSIIKSALNFDVGLDMPHPDTRANNYAIKNMIIDASARVHDIVREVFTCLFGKCLVRLVVKQNNFYGAALAAFLTDLMHYSGGFEVKCICYDRRDFPADEMFVDTLTSNVNNKLSVIAVVFKPTDTFAAAQGILESYFRDQYPNLIILVDESIYEKFVKDWQRYYSYAVQIGSPLDPKTTVIGSLNKKLQIDLNAIDIKLSHKMQGNVINVLKYRNVSELLSLINQLRKVPYMTIWNDDLLLAREFCLKVNISNDFWLNHIPKTIAGRKFPENQLNFYADTVAEDMAEIYNSISAIYSDEIEQLRKIQATFMKKNGRIRSMVIVQAFTSIVAKSKSLMQCSSVAESLAHLMRFQQGCLNKMSTSEAGEFRVEALAKPVGMAIMVVREENSIKSKAVLVEFIFKNLLIGNAMLLVCPPDMLGSKFHFENDHVIPFKMVHESMPDISTLSLDSHKESETSLNKKQCPKNTYAVEILPNMSNETCEAITVALGTQRKRIWYPDEELINYWS